MELKIFSIRDSKAGLYGQPFYRHTRLEAERSFNELVQDTTSMLNKYPDDYDLYHLGKYDDISGKIVSLDTPEHIIKANALIKI